MVAHQRAPHARAEHSRLARLPAQQARCTGEGQLLGQQTGPLRQSARDQHPPVLRQQRVARQHMSPVWVRANLPAELQRPEAAGHLQRLVAVGDHLRPPLPIARHRLGVELLPLQLDQVPQEVLPHLRRRLFQPVHLLAGWAGLTGRHRHAGQLRQLLTAPILLVDPTNQDTQPTHGDPPSFRRTTDHRTRVAGMPLDPALMRGYGVAVDVACRNRSIGIRHILWRHTGKE